ncbi:class I SAM-dependent methyltransferase [uncultured Clostridium sp.]|uniref:class I SAM-dependent methyltransferase n=1 Tax=uncultured Clostridium sp. TaxID=59620 RepID=UPI0028F0A242|nr:class I SAM-dependent methyltransferase [uncultured Clostridium sp.]
MVKEALIDLSNEKIQGNILDIGIKNYGVIYNVSKHFSGNFDVNYIDERKDDVDIEENYYDCCTLFFTLSSMLLKTSKESLFKDIYKYLKEEGSIYIWDIDKKYNKFFHSKIKIKLPDNNIKEINIKDYNIFRDNSKDNILKLLNHYFIITDSLERDGLYFIKAKKRESY